MTYCTHPLTHVCVHIIASVAAPAHIIVYLVSMLSSSIPVAPPCALYSTIRSCDPLSVLYSPVVHLALPYSSTVSFIFVTSLRVLFSSYVPVVCRCVLYSCLCTCVPPCAVYPSNCTSGPVCATGTFHTRYFLFHS